jgi:hypothetical protein
MKRLLDVLFWSVISAAFIGPGTVTTAATAGAGFGLQLAWALLFSTVACIALQEAVARLVIASGRGLGAAIRSTGGTVLAALTGFAIVLGCAAYEAGNILGGVAGAQLVLDLPRWRRCCASDSAPAAASCLRSDSSRRASRLRSPRRSPRR